MQLIHSSNDMQTISGHLLGFFITSVADNPVFQVTLLYCHEVAQIIH